MPLYDYICEKCSHQEERFQHSYKIKTAPCSKCGGVMHKQFPLIARVRMGPSLFVNRIDELQKRQADKGETPTLPHPSKVL